MQCEMCFVDGVGESDLNLLCDECTKKLTIINNMIYFVKELENSEHEELTDGECLDKLMDDIKKLYQGENTYGIKSTAETIDSKLH